MAATFHGLRPFAAGPDLVEVETERGVRDLHNDAALEARRFLVARGPRKPLRISCIPTASADRDGLVVDTILGSARFTAAGVRVEWLG